MPIKATLEDGTSKDYNSISDVIAELKHIKVLEWEAIKFEMHDLTQLLEAMRENRTLKKLYLRGNDKIGNKGAEYIAEYLQTNKTLTALYLVRCNISFEGVRAIVDALMHNETLKELNLAGNEIDDKAANLILQLLKAKQNLSDIILSNNPIINSSPFTDMLQNNYKLRNLSLNQISSAHSCGLTILSILSDNRKKVAISIIAIAGSGKASLYANKVIELAFNSYSDDILQNIMHYGSKTLDEAREILTKVKILYSKALFNHMNYDALPEDMRNILTSNLLPQFRDNYLKCKEAEKKVINTHKVI